MQIMTGWFSGYRGVENEPTKTKLVKTGLGDGFFFPRAKKVYVQGLNLWTFSKEDVVIKNYFLDK